tara:strand:+ start:357 stop:650 length:294 start_codon:yes stop_codon:yes gene_type:complete
MARRKNTKRIDPRYFLNETVNRLQEPGRETAEDVVARLKSMPVTMRSDDVTNFFNMMDGSTDMTGDYPHVENHREFATQVLKLLGELPASFRFTGRV